MIPRRLHFSVPDPMTEQQAAAIETARKLHPGWDIHIWHDDTPIENARLQKYLRRAPTGAQRADLIRLDAVSAYGGVYLDSDTRVLRPFDPLVEHHDFFIASEDGWNLTNALFGATPHHPAIEAIIAFLEENEPDWDAQPNQTTGPILFARLLRWRADVTVLPRETFYPYNWKDNHGQTHRLSYSAHLWAGSWMKHPAPPAKPAAASRDLGASVKRAAQPVLALGFAALRKLRQWADPPGTLQTRPHAVYAASDEIVVSTVHGQKLVLDGHDLSVTPDVALFGSHKWAEEAFVRRTLRGGDWFVDIGANVGTFTLLAASRCGPFGRVLAFEPNPHVRGLLTKSAALNRCHDRIRVHGMALADTEGTSTLSYYPHRLGDAQVDAAEKAAEPFAATGRFLSDRIDIDVPVRTLASVIPVNVPIRILKIDAEGHEPKVLAGSRRLLEERAFDYIMLEAEIELFAQSWADMLQCLRTLVAAGYRPASLDGNGFLIHYASLEEALRKRVGKTLVFSAL